jgi:phosphonate degradation associated HDIG domain protein/phosphonatase-like hydrolase
MKIEEILGEIFSLYELHGDEDYIGEPVSQLDHMTQAGELARKAGYDDDVVLAAFFHDIGHLLDVEVVSNSMNGFGAASHERIGAEYLRMHGFSEKIAALVASHVEAKRYLAFRRPGYLEKLSTASIHTLEFQGGIMNEDEASAFEKDPLFELKIRMRIWDDEAKEKGIPPADLRYFMNLAEKHLSGNKIKPMKTRLVVFDIAGTTVVDMGNVADSFKAAFMEHGFELPVHEVNMVMGYRKMEAIHMLLEKFYPSMGNSGEMIKAIHDSFEEKMLEFYMSDKDLRPMPFAEDVFRWLHSKGINVALNTGFTRLVTEGILYRLGWKENQLIDEVICSDEVEEGRPAPFMINRIMANRGIEDAGEVIKVGDTEVDISEGRNAGCGMVVSVTTGAYSRIQLQQFSPDYIIDGLDELPSLIM